MDECQPLDRGGASSDPAEQQRVSTLAAATAGVAATFQQTEQRPVAEVRAKLAALNAAVLRLGASSADEFGHVHLPFHLCDAFYTVEEGRCRLTPV